MRRIFGFNIIIVAILSLSVSIAKGFKAKRFKIRNGITAYRDVSDKIKPADEFIPDSMVGVLELRNYRLKSGKRDDFIKYFKEHFVRSQNEAGAQILGQFRVEGAPDNFFWFRGFSSMAARTAYLPAFYYGPVWKAFGHGANDMLSNNDDVYLLKPITWKDNGQTANDRLNVSINENYTGVTVVDFYISNHKLDKLIAFIGKSYLPVLKTMKMQKTTFWVSELSENDFPKLPVFQDNNLLISIAHYKNEQQYKEKTKQILRHMTPEEKNEFDDLVTKKTSMILYPAKN